MTFKLSKQFSGSRAIVYTETGNPISVLSSISYPSLPPPAPNTVNVKFLLCPINPADLNVIEGVYPKKPYPRTTFASSGKGSKEHPVFVAGNEGLAEITAVGHGVSDLKEGQWVIVTKQQAGTWASCSNFAADDVLEIPREGLTEVQGATMTVRDT